MFSIQNAGISSALAVCGFSLLLLTPSAFAQNREVRNFSCESGDGQRQYCDADTSRSTLRLLKQSGDVSCVEGYTWGREDGRVWVDRGCRAQFQLLSDPPRRVVHVTRIEPGTVIDVRTNEPISERRNDGRIFTGSVETDIVAPNGQLAIPQGANVEMIVRIAPDQDLILDLESVTIDGQRYAIEASPQRVEAKDGVGANERTGRYVGGGAIFGAIIGAVVGGGKGAAIGAGVGAAGGAVGQMATKGREVSIPSESVVSFRVERAFVVSQTDDGRLDNGVHYHDDGQPDGGQH